MRSAYGNLVSDLIARRRSPMLELGDGCRSKGYIALDASPLRQMIVKLKKATDGTTYERWWWKMMCTKPLANGNDGDGLCAAPSAGMRSAAARGTRHAMTSLPS
jgi:hypothetical protein